MTTTTADWIAETEALVLGGIREARNRLGTALTNTTGTAVSLAATASGLTAGSVIAIDLEEMYVEASDGNGSLTVVRGDGGSLAATHLVNSVVYINPRQSKFRILRAINNGLRALSSPRNGLFKATYVDVTYNAAVRGYDLTSVTDMVGEPLRLLWKKAGSEKDWPEIRHYRFSDQLPTTDFASGKAIFLDEAAQPGNTIRVYYRAPFSLLSALTDDVSTTGVPITAYDLPPLAAAVSLLATKPNERADIGAQGNSRDAQEVSTTDTLNASSGLRLLLRDRINDEAGRLAATWPTRLT